MVPLFDVLIKQHTLFRNLISYSYVYKDEERYGFHSQMTFGYIDPSLYMGEIKWYPIVHKVYMTIQIKDILFNNQSFGYCGTGAKQCYLTPDSGMSYMSVPLDYSDILSKKGINKVQECDPHT